MNNYIIQYKQHIEEFVYFLKHLNGLQKKERKKQVQIEYKGVEAYTEEYTEDDEIISLENFCKENEINDTSSGEDNLTNLGESILSNKRDNENENEEGNEEGKVIDMIYVSGHLNSINKNISLKKVVKLLTIFKDALNLFIVDEVQDELPKIADKKEAEKEKKKKKKKNFKNGKSCRNGRNDKIKYAMDVDTSLFVIFNVVYNINEFFYNMANEADMGIKIWNIESIKNNELFEVEKNTVRSSSAGRDINKKIDGNGSKGNSKSNNKSYSSNSSNSELGNMYSYKHIQKYRPFIVYFFNTLLQKIKKLNNDDVCSGIIKIIKRKEILRWIIIFSYGKIFLKKICKFFIITKKNDIYFFLYILIQNMFELYNEKKKIILNSLSKCEYDEEKEIKKAFDVEKLIYAIYQNFLQTYLLHYGHNYYNIIYWNFMNFKENCLIELFSYLSHDVAFTIAFRYIQIIIQKIREQFKVLHEERKSTKGKSTQEGGGKKRKKKKENEMDIEVEMGKVKGKSNAKARTRGNKKDLIHLEEFHLHSSYMILLIRFLIKIIKVCDNLDNLTYGLTILIIAILKTKINHMKFIPFNLQLINFLIRIIEDKKKYIPLFSYFTCILNGLKSYKHIRSISKNQTVRLTIENFDINSSLQIDEKLIADFSIAHQIYDKIYVLLFDYIGLMVHHISFPEFFFAIESYLKKYYAECEIHLFKVKIKNLLVHAKSSIDIILNKRKNIDIYTVHDKINHFENEKFPLSNQRLIILKNYEDCYLTKIKGKLSGLQNIKNMNSAGNNQNGQYDKEKKKKNIKRENKKEREEERAAHRREKRAEERGIEMEKEKKRKKKDIKRKKEDLNCVDNSFPKKTKTATATSSTAVPEADKLEVFSMSSEEEQMP
ncbi:nucleolar complex protein 2, putative [Plasmodium malariae]|uniref:Nucleolar complex protein 2, putative n=1 Tax=Plasmodium malariae TaxID=5858 RepID=A0A1C3L0H2_PLAMA|nr:nucleolar complex protein 2, putative [Plasmodium malariae]